MKSYLFLLKMPLLCLSFNVLGQIESGEKYDPDFNLNTQNSYESPEEDYEGVWQIYYENGQMKFEGTFKDGKLISSKRWNEDGSLME